jgi:hypothetical protein
MRTRAEVRAFLDSQVGKIPQHPAPYQDLSGQCVTGVKVLLDFLGVPNPYAARGNATDVDDTLLRQGIADNGKGWLTIVVNHDMGFIGGVHYGHIWTDLAGEANYESNGNRALYMTKNTRPISQGQQFVNLDKWIGDDNMANPVKGDVDNILGELWGRPPNPEDYGYTQQNWHDAIYGMFGAYPWRNRFEILQNKYPQAVKDLEIVSGIAETRSRNLQTVCDALGVPRQPDEQVTSQAIVDKYNLAVKAQHDAEAAQKTAQGQVTDLQAQVKALQTGDNIVITKEGWTGLFDVIKQFFAKKK